MRTDNGHYIVFNYDNPAMPQATTCIIKNPNKDIVVSSTVVKYHKDAMSKPAARKFALGKALREGNFSREERTMFWNTYRQHVKA